MRPYPAVRAVGAVLCAAALTLVPTSAGARVTSASSSGSDLQSALRATMQATLDAGATSMIARVDDGDEVTSVAVGAARLDPRVPAVVRDQVRVGSITKSMVATVTLQLVGEGKLRLGDTLERWLPGAVPNGGAITLKMLLNHTSGIYNYTDDPSFIPAVIADPNRYWSPQELIALANSHPPVFPPGTSWSYSNTGYILIGLILQKVTGEPIQRLLAERVFQPLHLHSTFFATSGQFRGPYAHGYIPPSLTGDGYLDASHWRPSWAWAAGAVVSNAPDLARFYTTLMSGHLLRPGLLARMTTTVDTGQGFRYGLGLFRNDTPCGTLWGHDGGIPGYISFAYTDRSGDRSIVLLLPTQPDDAIVAAGEQALAVAVCGMFGKPVPSTSAAAKASAPAFRLPTTG